MWGMPFFLHMIKILVSCIFKPSDLNNFVLVMTILVKKPIIHNCFSNCVFQIAQEKEECGPSERQK